ncbi:AI-2E family transporter [Fictibacillus iocasae]|uniref:AI-2E family transporter n=1 Tax=Fictibacillus iocasae TaxID=2715437 RepID=A0ABW2NWX2_9BACL
MSFKHSFFRYAAAIIMILLILYLFGKIDYLVNFFRLIISAVFFPLLISFLLYYLLRPFVRLLQQKQIPKGLAISFVFALLFILLSTIWSASAPIVAKQLSGISADFPRKIGEATEQTGTMITGANSFIDSKKLAKSATERLEKFTSSVGKDVTALISMLTDIALVLVVVPFILFYLLKDDEKFFRYCHNIVPKHLETELSSILRDIDATMASYIKGQIIVAVFVGIFMYAGYLIIGLKFALILALFAVLTNVIPFLGPFIGVFPALLVAIIQDPFMAVKVAIVTLIVQQVEGNILSPNIMGKQLNIHPLTIILIVLIAGAVGGFIGLLIAVPAYALMKTLISSLYRLYLLYNPPEVKSDLL